jgi:hypothetical protein
MKFTDWVVNECFGTPTDEAYALAKYAWSSSQLNTLGLIAKSDPFTHLMTATQCRIVNKINEGIKGHGYSFVLTAEGLVVVPSYDGDEPDVEVELLANRVFNAI